jgi:hypothetical protein
MLRTLANSAVNLAALRCNSSALTVALVDLFVTRRVIVRKLDVYVCRCLWVERGCAEAYIQTRRKTNGGGPPEKMNQSAVTSISFYFCIGQLKYTVLKYRTPVFTRSSRLFTPSPHRRWPGDEMQM